MEDIHCCENHIDMGMDDFINKYETFPIMTRVLSVKCDYCNLDAIYLLSKEIINKK
jgi:CxxH/CxxC protein (TIGR04129 family)